MAGRPSHETLASQRAHIEALEAKLQDMANGQAVILKALEKIFPVTASSAAILPNAMRQQTPTAQNPMAPVYTAPTVPTSYPDPYHGIGHNPTVQDLQKAGQARAFLWLIAAARDRKAGGHYTAKDGTLKPNGKGVHVVIEGVNETMAKLFPGCDPRTLSSELQAKGLLRIFPVKRGAIVVLAQDMATEQRHAPVAVFDRFGIRQ